MADAWGDAGVGVGMRRQRSFPERRGAPAGAALLCALSVASGPVPAAAQPAPPAAVPPARATVKPEAPERAAAGAVPAGQERPPTPATVPSREPSQGRQPRREAQPPPPPNPLRGPAQAPPQGVGPALTDPLAAAPVPADAAGAEVRRLLADIDAGGIGEALSDVPNFIGDGCAPGVSTSKIPVGRLAVVGPFMFLQADRANLRGQSAAVYEFPGGLDSVAALQAAGVAGLPPGAKGPLADIAGPINIAVTDPKGGPGSIGTPGNDYPAIVDGVFQGLYPASKGATTYVQPDSGFLGATPGTAPVFTSYAFYDYVVDTAVLTPGANVGFVKLSENVSPLPRDRVYFNYSFFDNALLGDIRGDVSRFTPGVEKTFADGWTSVEVRTPFAATVSSTQSIDPSDPCGIADAEGIEFGNLSVIFKSIVALGDTWAVTGGLQVMLPTASDVAVLSGPGGPALVRIDNQSTRLMPFTGFIWAPDDRVFGQSLLQIDTAANGNPAFIATPGGSGLAHVGELQYPTFMYLSFSAGYWAHRSDTGRLTGVAPIVEVHVNQAFQASDVIRSSQYSLGADYGVTSLVNGLVGCNFEWGNRSTATVAYVTPFGGGADRWFDGELRAFWNYRFGPQNRLTRVQF